MKLYHKNPRQITEKQFTDLGGSLSRLGDLGGIVHDLNSDEIIGGNQRSRVFNINQCEIELVEQFLEPDDQGTVGLGFVVWKGKRYAYRQVRWTPEQCAEANIRANKAGGGWDFDTLANEFELGDLLEWGFEKNELDLDLWMPDQPEHKQPNERNLPLDIIYTLQMADCTCCLAVLAGWKYGIQSAHYRLCPYTYQLSGRHEVAFIDNDYFNYDHQKHLDAVRILKPKYATVRDVMTEEQCRADDIRFYPLEMILDWAEELSEYAENVIVIPKYDCLDKIPEKFMLGYSIPTSHGGTPLDIKTFKGRRLHLLGGSWKAQLDYLAEAGDDVVSLDNNMLQKIASEFGLFTFPNGSTKSIKDEFLEDINNVRYSALALSFGFIGSKINQLYAGNGKPGEENKTDD